MKHKKTTPQGGFGNDFGNEGVVSLQTLVPPIDLAETRDAIRLFHTISPNILIDY